MKINRSENEFIVNKLSYDTFEEGVLNHIIMLNFALSNDKYEIMNKEIDKEIEIFAEENKDIIISYKTYRGFTNKTKIDKKISRLQRKHKNDCIKILRLIDGFVLFKLKDYMDDKILQITRNIVDKHIENSISETKSDYTKAFLKIMDSQVSTEMNNYIIGLYICIYEYGLEGLEIDALKDIKLTSIDKHKLELILQNDFTTLIFALKNGDLDKIKIDDKSIIEKIQEEAC